MLGLHIDCEAGGKWVKDDVCSACGEQVYLCRRPSAEPRNAERLLMEVMRTQEEREQPHNLGFAIGEPGRPLDSGDGLACGGKHRGDCFGVEPPGAHLLAEDFCGKLGRQRRAVGTRLRHGVVGVGRRK